MQRAHQIVFVVSLLMLNWLAMMAVHELGHIVGALLSGGTVERVVLHPLTISRTDVSPNPFPLLVVWLGPVLGCAIPAVILWCVPHRCFVTRQLVGFFAGFCLLANGAYIAFGSWDRIGDCGVMLQHRSPGWTLLLFGAMTIPAGLYLWHRLGSIQQLLEDPALIDPAVTCAIVFAVIVISVVEFTTSPL